MSNEKTPYVPPEVVVAGKRSNIISITPPDQDPVLYWHQVAQDAISARERADARRKEDRAELERLQQYERNEKSRHMKDVFEQTVPSFRELMRHVNNGDFSMTVQFSFYPNKE